MLADRRSQTAPSWSLIQCAFVVGLLLATVLPAGGCARQRYISVRHAPRNPLEGPLRLISRTGPRPTSRTEQLLRRYDLAKLEKEDLGLTLQKLSQEIASEPGPEKVYSYAELAYIHGKRLEAKGKSREALDQFGASVSNAYQYLFEPGLDRFRNPYDPQFRRACDLYNSSLESALRIVLKQNKLRPGEIHSIDTGSRKFTIQTELHGPWHPDDIARLEFVSDYEIIGGLTNQHHTYGLGVPLIAIRTRHAGEEATEKYYPRGLSFPVTAFLRAAPQSGAGDNGSHHCVLELHDPLRAANIEVANRVVPLETDLSTPLAYFLDSPEFQETDISTWGLLNPGGAVETKVKGLYMVEPYDPARIPVLMVHGLWSSPTTWMEMFNDLRAYPELRSRYQFWFYLYPTGQPFWVSAAQLRDSLAETRQSLDPSRTNPHLDQMILVGHSMGGLVSKLQTLDSGDDFWRILSHRPFDELRASPEDKARLAKCIFFAANPSIRRVVTIGTPHRGSTFSNSYTRLAAQGLIKLPEMMEELTNKLIRDNSDFFTNTDLLTMTNSIDSLAPSDPIFPVILAAQTGPGVKYHNIVGLVPRQGFVSKLSEEGDGVVGFTSAHLDNVDSELVVAEEHMNVHRHPLAILEVRRILLDHAAELEQTANLAAGAPAFP
jgi:pimeloyl-ACP methyl ester carboxylesterase